MNAGIWSSGMILALGGGVPSWILGMPPIFSDLSVILIVFMSVLSLTWHKEKHWIVIQIRILDFLSSTKRTGDENHSFHNLVGCISLCC